MGNIFFHIDVNSAFLSWTALDLLEKGNPTDLRLIPSAVGGDIEKRHGIVLAKSIPAKAYHITTGEPIVRALSKCPSLTVVPPDHTMYARKSAELMDYLKTICPEIEQVSIDECYMDFTPISSSYPSPMQAAQFIKDSIYEKMGFTVNIGISDKKVLAKMASDFKKPNLVHTLYTNEIKQKMWPLPVSSLFMCGKSSVEELHKLGILTIGDLACANPDILSLHLKSHGKMLWEYANGIDNSKIESVPSELKGIGNSTTLPNDVDDLDKIHHVLLALADSVAARLRKAGNLAYMVSVEIKYATFSKASHQTTLSVPTQTTEEIYHTACMLFEELWDKTPVRLLGIRTSRLVDASEPIQLSLFDYHENPKDYEKQKKLDNAIDDIKKKYGKNAIVRGSMLYQEPPSFKE
ncbi:MAG: DNA polymerase IV [Lachnospiraceae bacterium]